jgi:protoporphyrinogen IX oxidase
MYLWIKALHVMSVIAWFAGLFYIFRLFVYHVKYRHVAGVPAVHAEMESKLLRLIMTPAMVTSLLFGAWMLVLSPSLLAQRWMHAKLGCVVLLIAYQLYAMRVHRRFARGDYVLSETACRFINEVPTLLLIGIVIAVIVRP